VQDDHEKKLEQVLESSRVSRFNEEELKTFVKEPYVILPTKREDEWWVVVPKFIQMQVGWLERSTESYNIFKVNKFINWLGDIPTLLKDKFKFKPELPVKVFDGMVLTGKKHQGETWDRYKNFLIRKEGEDKIRIKRGAEFRLIAQMIDDGTLPFLPKQVSKKS
jgi:DNA excision repair protein ERCC-3